MFVFKTTKEQEIEQMERQKKVLQAQVTLLKELQNKFKMLKNS